MARLKVTQTRSEIGGKQNQRDTLRSLGLKRIGDVVVKEDRGEGGKRGKTAGRGTKGTKARYQVRPSFEGGSTPIHMRLPKLRGFKNPFKTEFQVVNLDKLGSLYPSGGDVTVDDLVAKLDQPLADGERHAVAGGSVTVK